MRKPHWEWSPQSQDQDLGCHPAFSSLCLFFSSGSGKIRRVTYLLLLPLPAPPPPTPADFWFLSSSCSLPLLLLPRLMPDARTPEPGPQLPHQCRGVAGETSLGRPVQPRLSVDLIFFSGSFRSAGHCTENLSPAQSILIQCSHIHSLLSAT